MSESDVNPLLRKALKNRLKIKGLSNPNKIKVPQVRKKQKVEEEFFLIVSNSKRKECETPKAFVLFMNVLYQWNRASTMKIPAEITQDNLDY